MNKNLILGLAVAGALYWQFGRKKGEPESTESYEGSPIISPTIINGDTFAKYNNRVLVDANGFWMLIKNGKIYSPIDQSSLDKYSRENPNLPFLTVNEDIWKYYSENFPKLFVGGF